MDRQVDRNPWIQTLTRLGWAAKGVVYALMGIAAIEIATERVTSDKASPQGALQTVTRQPGGRLLLFVVGVGLILYVAWRVLSVALIADWDGKAWLKRVAYSFSALFYGALAWTALASSLHHQQPQDGNFVETLSRSVLRNATGRVLLGAAGVVTIGVGVYFVVAQAIQRKFTDEITGVSPDPRANRSDDEVLLVAGIIGWIGRGVVTAIVGFFVLRAAIRFDPNDARGFDRSLRDLAANGPGRALVWVVGVGLIAYALFCLLTVRRRRLDVDR